MSQTNKSTLRPRARAVDLRMCPSGRVSGVVATNPAARLFFWEHVSPNKVVQMAAQELNKRLPMKVDDFTRWDRAEALPNTTLRYCYTVSDVEADADSIAKTMTPMLIENYRSSDEMKILRDIRATLVYKYSDEAGREILEITIKHDEL